MRRPDPKGDLRACQGARSQPATQPWDWPSTGTLAWNQDERFDLFPARQLLPGELFDQIMQTALQPFANETRQPESFYERYRLVGVDGMQWSVSDTPASLRRCRRRRVDACRQPLRSKR